ncbi:MAG: hypothetical protein FWF33_00105 [Clostridiales bacterium]|nr:hypothetical protein [Clostridiales bacterium]
MIYEEMTKQIREAAKRLLKEGAVDVILAYRGGGLNEMQVPFFVKKPEDAELIEWGDRCYQNLAPYVHGLNKKVGILAKPCDVRAIVQYITEFQIERDKVTIIGVDCIGMVDENGNARPGCSECRVHKPPVYDEYIRDERAANLPAIEPKAGETTLEENLERFQKEIDKCILCYSCRQACYGCYCKTCFIERDMPDWQPAEIDTGTKITFHMGRAMHLAGRCVDCGACEAACQSGVNVRYIIREVTKFIEDAYGYSAGMDAEEPPALLTNKFDDKEFGFLGGERHE